MTTQPKYYDIEDYQTGKRYRVEALAEDTTYDEAVSFISELSEDQLVQYEYTPPAAPVSVRSAAPQVAEPVDVSTPRVAEVEIAKPDLSPRDYVPAPSRDANDYQLGMDQFMDFSPEEYALDNVQKKQLLQMANNPEVPLSVVEEFLKQSNVTADLPMVLSSIQEARDKGVPFGSVVQDNPFEGMVDPVAIQAEYSSDNDSWFAQIGRSVTEGWADPASLMNAMSRTGKDFFNVYEDELKKQFPDASPEELAELENRYVAYMAKMRGQAAAEAVSDDDFVPWLIGQFLAIEPTDIIPIGRGVRAATKGGRIIREGVNAAGIGAATDLAGQGLAISSGAQDDFDPLRTLGSAALSGVIGSAAQGVGEVFGRQTGRLEREGSAEPRIATPTISVPTARRNSKKYQTQLEETQQGVIEQVNRITEGWTNAPEIEVHTSFTDVDGLDNSSVGVYTTKTLDDGTTVPIIRINSEGVARLANKKNLAPEDVVKAVTFHEALGHHGLSSVFKQELDNFLDDIYTNGEAKFRRDVDRWLENNPTAYSQFDETQRRILATEEVLAELSEEGPLTRSKLDSFLNYVKDFVRTRLGWDLEYSRREIKAYLAVAHDRTMSGKKSEAAPSTTKDIYVGEQGVTSANLSQADDLRWIREKYEDERGFTPFEEMKELNEKYGPAGIARQDTGWFRGLDGEWRYEISDLDATLTVDKVTLDTPYKLGDVLDHKELYRVYPSLKERVKVIFEEDSPNNFGYFDPNTNTIGLNLNARDASRHRLLSTLLHEVQHNIQEIEGFAVGGGAKTAAKKMPMNELLTASKRLQKHLDAERKEWQMRLELLGEAEKILKENKRGILKLRGLSVDEFLEVAGVPPQRPSDMSVDKYYELRRQLTNAYYDVKNNNRSIVRDLMNKKLQMEQQLREGIKTKDRNKILLVVQQDSEASFSAYEHLAGEIEARDVEIRKDYDYIERYNNAPYSGEPDIDLDSAIIDAGGGPYYSSTDKYMRGDSRTPDEGDFERRMSDILREIRDAYVPTNRSFDEARRAASLAGLKKTQYSNPRGLEDLDVRLFQYDTVNERYQEKLLRLGQRIDNPKNANDFVRASAEYKKTLYEYKLLTSKIQEDQAQIARALNAMKALNMTKRKLNETLGLLDEHFGNKTEAEAFAAFDDPETFAALVKTMTAHIQQGNTLGAAKVAEKVGKPYWWQYVLSYLHNSMLSGIGTQAVNTYDAINILGRKLEERVVGGVIGTTRKAAGAKETMSLMEGVGFAYGILRATADAETYKNAYRAFKEGYEFQPFGTKIERQDARIPYLSKVNDLLYASDMFWRAFHMSANLYSLGIRKAHNEGFTGKQLFEEGYANAINADKDLMDEAKRHADEALLVDKPSYLTGKIEAAKTIKPNMSFGAQLGSFIANILFPFLRVSDRLVFQALKRIPGLAFLDHNTRREWEMGGAARDAVLARQMMGAALISYYWMMADPEREDEEGFIEGYAPPNYKKTQALEATGYRPETVVEEDMVMRNANQINITANPFNTRNNIAVMVASIRQDWERSKKTKEDANEVSLLLAAALRAGGTFIMQQGYADNVTPYVNALRRDPEQETAEAAVGGELAGRAVPALVRQLNQMYFDPVKRDTTGDKSAGDRIVGRIQSSLPGLSNLLPANVTALGEEQEQGRTLLRLGDGTPIKQGNPYTELRELEREIPEPVLTEFRGSFDYEGENIKLNAFERNKWQSVQGQYLRDVMMEWIASPEWKTMTSEEKVDLVKDIREEAYDYAKEQLLDELLEARGL